jgi:hypothetical protein
MEISLLKNPGLSAYVNHYERARPFVTAATHGNIAPGAGPLACNESTPVDE